METRRLQYFIEVCKAGSMTRAATRLDLSQAALSQQIAILETEFKTRLLDRSRTGVKATAAGEMLLREAQIILRQVAPEGRMRPPDSTMPMFAPRRTNP